MRRAASALLAGTLLAVTAPAGWLLLRDDGEFVVEQQAAQPVVPAPEVTGPPVASAPSVGTTSARLGDVANASDPPVSVRLAGVEAPVDPVGLDADRLVVVPDDVSRAGWYQPGAQPGDGEGAAVLVGHVDDARQGLGAFAVLRELDAGQQVTVRTASGREVGYEVVSRERHDKDDVPLAELFALDGPPRLVLISCDGAFDPATRSYEENVVVTAVPL